MPNHFFLQLASFTVLGQLRLAFMNKWDKVDRILEEQGLNQKDAFRYLNYSIGKYIQYVVHAIC